MNFPRIKMHLVYAKKKSVGQLEAIITCKFRLDHGLVIQIVTQIYNVIVQ